LRGLRSWLERRRVRDHNRLAGDQDLGDSTEPRFGYGLNDRPLWSQRDRDAEDVRRVLRGAGCVEWSGEPPYHDGFVVEGGDDGEPFAVACTLDDRTAARAEVMRYRDALRAGEYRVQPDPDDAQCLEVWPPSRDDRS
jgi:hypothetical protein